MLSRRRERTFCILASDTISAGRKKHRFAQTRRDIFWPDGFAQICCFPKVVFGVHESIVFIEKWCLACTGDLLLTLDGNTRRRHGDIWCKKHGRPNPVKMHTFENKNAKAPYISIHSVSRIGGGLCLGQFLARTQTRSDFFYKVGHPRSKDRPF